MQTLRSTSLLLLMMVATLVMSSTYEVKGQCLATLTPDGPTTFCSNKPITLTASAGSYYEWYKDGFAWGYHEQSLVTSVMGTYKVVVTDASGCNATSNSVNLTVYYTYPNAGIGFEHPGFSSAFCEGFQRTIFANPSNVNPTDTYQWSTGETGPSITVNQTGSYTVTVTNALGCSKTSQPLSILVYPKPGKPIITPIGPTTFCQGQYTWLTTVPPGAGYTFRWYKDDGLMANLYHEFLVTEPGKYNVLVTNSATGCTSTSDPVFINILPAAPSSTVTPSGAYSSICGSLEVTANVPSNTQFVWTHDEVDIPGSENLPKYKANKVGRFMIRTVTADGCSKLSSNYVFLHKVTSINDLQIVAGGPTTFCAGGSVTLSSNAPPGATHYWSYAGGSSSSPTLNVTTSGTYFLRVVQDGCTFYANNPIQVTVLVAPVASVTGSSNTTCTKNVTLTASQGSSYLWSTGATTREVIVNQPGSYTVTVTNESGCSKTSVPYSIVEKSFTVSIYGKTTFCQGNHAELYSLTSDNVSFCSYLWSDGKITSSNWPTSGGTYWVVATDYATGCKATSPPVTVTRRMSIGGTISASAPCYSFNPVMLTANPSGGKYSWSTGASTRSITTSTTDNYFVGITTSFSRYTACFDLYPCFYPIKSAENDYHGVQEIEPQVYPNPADKELIIMTYKPVEADFDVTVFDLEGRKVLTDYLKEGEYQHVIVTNGLPNGLYVLSIKTTDRIIVKRILVSHDRQTPGVNTNGL